MKQNCCDHFVFQLATRSINGLLEIHCQHEKQKKGFTQESVAAHVRCADVFSVFTQSVSLFFLKHEVIAAKPDFTLCRNKKAACRCIDSHHLTDSMHAAFLLLHSVKHVFFLAFFFFFFFLMLTLCFKRKRHFVGTPIRRICIGEQFAKNCLPTKTHLLNTRRGPPTTTSR